ncbi:hypothetical protein GOBAR_DD31510 [Gossypium barbadense]|nr:hypothetical protein GOBAR_DD31510 [Gossypium barbadense]
MECRLSGGLNYAGDRGKLKGQRMETNPSNQRLLGSIVLWRAKIPKKTWVSLVVQLEINLLKENDHSNMIELADDNRTKVLDSDDSTFKGHIIEGKFGTGQNKRRLNKTIQD